jgi:hypothetical protein
MPLSFLVSDREETEGPRRAIRGRSDGNVYFARHRKVRELLGGKLSG